LFLNLEIGGNLEKMAQTKPRVRLLAYTPEPEKLVAHAARLCYAKDEAVKKMFEENIDNVSDSEFIRKLAEMRHLSPFEHPSWSFLIEGVSRAMTHQLVRHRVASHSQRSQRYVSHKDFDYVIPETICQSPRALEKFEQTMVVLGEAYEGISKMLEEDLGLKGEARNQDARYVLPNACETKILTTMNGRELVDVFFPERMCNRAQWEIRGVARQMFELAQPTAPNMFSYAGPACYTEGRCNQGEKCCGKAGEIKAYFEKFGAK